MNFHSKTFSENFIICPFCSHKEQEIRLYPGDSVLLCNECNNFFMVQKLDDVGYETYEYAKIKN